MGQFDYARGKGTGEIRLVSRDGVEKRVLIADVFKLLNVSSLIRVPNAEYPETAEPGEILTHFGLPIKDDPAGTVAVLARIVKHGHFQNFEKTEAPLLSLENVWLVKVVLCVQQVSYDQIIDTKDYFNNSIGEIYDFSSLKKVITRRYSKVLTNLTEEEILTQGVSVRKLLIVERCDYGGDDI